MAMGDVMASPVGREGAPFSGSYVEDYPWGASGPLI